MGTAQLARPLRGRIVAGVAAGVADRLAVDAVFVRAGFVALTAAGGLGLGLYGIVWALTPSVPAARTDPEPGDWTRPLGVVLIVVGALFLCRQLGLWLNDSLGWFATLVSFGVATIWRHLDVDVDRALPADRRLWLSGAGLVRVAAGAALVMAGMVGFLVSRLPLAAVREGTLAGVTILAGVGLVFGPWWWRVARQMADERRRRVRSEERAEMAAHLHDSVLQTLALIQRCADQPGDVAALARQQERELRRWLYQQETDEDSAVTSIGRALEDAAAEIEARHDVEVDVVIVGDRARLVDSEDVAAVLGAAREAMVNAAKFSGCPSVSVYAEATPTRLEIFVRDRGPGFDLDAVATDRRGIAESIIGRMRRAGGTATIHTAPGEGTEVELVLSEVG